MTSPTLRPLTSADAASVLDAFTSDPEQMSRQGDITDIDSARRYVEALCASKAQRPWAVTVDNELVGLVCVSVDQSNLNGWFWYWMHPSARGMGWTRAAAATVADWALTTAGLHRLELGYRTNNPASGAVARAAGFLPEGLEREKFLIEGTRYDVQTCSRLATDPFPPHDPLPMTAPAD